MSRSILAADRFSPWFTFLTPAERVAQTALVLAAGLVVGLAPVHAQEASDVSGEPESADVAGDEQPDVSERIKASTFSSVMRGRSIGPAVASGRIGDLAINPNNGSEYFVAASSGGVWKTTNHGTTFTPVFDREGSYSIGCVTIDPSNTNTVWVGTGENNSQRSVSFGDGVYKSVDGGKTWKNMGLKDSEHIGMIVVHPNDSETVYVAAQGPLWRSGGERGLYKTSNGGKTWRRILDVSDDTGVNEVFLDPRDPDTMYASAYQRRRRVWTLIDGGPESGIYKSTDGGETWRTINRGLPGGDKGRIGMDISPVNPDVLYAIVEASSGGGFFRSTNRGETWSKRSSYMTSSPQYYNELKCDPVDVDKVYVYDTFLMRTEDGGATFVNKQGRSRHVDNHALWIDPEDTRHMLVGCDGGLYESWDDATTWLYKPNLPLTQFYRVSVDNAEPFYNVYGGTQDNATLGGPSRSTRSRNTNADWFVTVGGDGFETQVDPTDPNIVYSQWQYGGLVRHDRLSGENVDIKPQPKPGDEPFVFNWDAPLLISPHAHTRIYFGGRQLYRSEDRGDSWTAISGNLSRGLDRNELEVMGRIQPVEAVARHMSTSIYGSIVAISESPLVEDLIYVGTDDGLIQVTDDGGENWRTIEVFPGVPDQTYVSQITASLHDADTVFATFDNHKNGDFQPYILVSRDRGQTWDSIVGDLGEREIVYSIAEDHVQPRMLIVGTEFGAYYTMNGGDTWMKIGGLPTIAVRDVAIQRRENDIAFATFGRGFYVVDDYSPLQTVSNDALDADAFVFPVRDALLYVPSRGGAGSQGSTYYTTENPLFGAVFTYNLKKKVSHPKADPALPEDEVGKPNYERIRAEERRRSPSVFLTIRNDEGEVVERVSGSTGEGIHRTAWNLRHKGRGPYALPGTYTVTVAKEVNGEVTVLSEPRAFEVVPLELGTFQPEDRAEVLAFHKRVAKLSDAVSDVGQAMSEAEGMVSGLDRAIANTFGADPALAQEAHEISLKLKDIRLILNGDSLPGKYQEPTLPGLRGRVRLAVSSWGMTAPPTQTQRDAYEYAAAEFGDVLEQLRGVLEEDIPALQKRLDEAGVPWTPGRLPRWDRD
jgi:photosystem II stability/assembly factor-like uncharacterized protein